jgi:hypothetical protein
MALYGLSPIAFQTNSLYNQKHSIFSPSPCNRRSGATPTQTTLFKKPPNVTRFSVCQLNLRVILLASSTKCPKDLKKPINLTNMECYPTLAFIQKKAEQLIVKNKLR